MLIVVILSVVIVGGVVGISAAPPPNAQEKIVTHVTNDNTVRALQVFDISLVEKGSQITSTSAIFTLSSNVGDDCVLMLNEPHLNKDEISDPFVCQIENAIPLKINGVHTLQTKLNSENFNIEVKSINDGIIDIPSNSITLDIAYLTPTYFALVENGIVTSVIVSDQNFIDTLDGEWVGYDNNVKAWIGSTWDVINQKFIPVQPYPSWTLNGVQWESPIPYPIDGLPYTWNEFTTSWVEMK